MQVAQSRNKQSPVIQSFWRMLVRWQFLIFQRQRYSQLVLEHVHGCPVLVLPNVCHPRLFFSSEFLVEQLDDSLIPPGSTVLDMGSGSGVGAITAACWARRVIAVDINPDAVRCTRINALLNAVEDRVKVQQGDLFAPVSGQRFNVVLFNPPIWFHGMPGTISDRTKRSIDVVKRFSTDLCTYLAPGGYALVVLSSHADVETFLEAFHLHGLRVEVLSRRDMINELLTLYRLTPTTR